MKICEFVPKYIAVGNDSYGVLRDSKQFRQN
jgi:hypothetical protein